MLPTAWCRLCLHPPPAPLLPSHQDPRSPALQCLWQAGAWGRGRIAPPTRGGVTPQGGVPCTQEQSNHWLQPGRRPLAPGSTHRFSAAWVALAQGRGPLCAWRETGKSLKEILCHGEAVDLGSFLSRSRSTGSAGWERVVTGVTGLIAPRCGGQDSGV